MTSRVRSDLEAKVLANLPNNTDELITRPPFNEVLTDLVDTCFRDDLIQKQDGDRILNAAGDKYIGLNVTP